jgi:hypothetical protein
LYSGCMTETVSIQELRRRQKLLDQYWHPDYLTDLYLDALEGKFPMKDWEIIRDGLRRLYPNTTADVLQGIKKMSAQLAPAQSLTKREAVEAIRKMGYTLKKAKLGWHVDVDTADNAVWRYWRPTQALADATGRARLFREVETFEKRHGLVAPEALIRKTAHQLHPSYTPSMHEEWEAEFKKLG